MKDKFSEAKFRRGNMNRSAEIKAKFEQWIVDLPVSVRRVNQAVRGGSIWIMPDEMPDDENTFYFVQVGKDGCYAQVNNQLKYFDQDNLVRFQARCLVLEWAEQRYLRKSTMINDSGNAPSK